MNRKTVYDSLSDYIDGSLPPPERQGIEAQIEQDPAAAREMYELTQVLEVLHTLPRREPVLDLWRELAPKVAAIHAEERLGIPARLRLRAQRFLASFAEGTILFTQALAMNTEARMGKYLPHDPLALRKEA
jgi:anti-sigma factor RsiW